MRFKERDASYSGGLYGVSVMKFNGTVWELIGERGIISCWSGCALRLDNNDVPYIASAQGTSDDINTLRIFKYDGTEWVEPAPGPQSQQTVFGLNIRFNSANIPHVAYTEFDPQGGTDDVLTVKTWTGTAWEKLGDPILDGVGYYPRIEFNNQDKLYISFQDYSYGPAPAGVKVWDGISWEYVGNLGSINNRAEYIDLALDQNQQPWISYSNVFSNYNVSIYQYVNNVTTYSVFFNIADGLEPEITLEGFAPQIAIGGTATFTNVPETPAPGIPYTIELDGYENISGNVIVDGDELVNINMTSTNISEQQKNQFLVYPNPSTGNFTIETTNLKNFINPRIEITDITGKTIYNSQLAACNTQLDISNQPKGIYFIKITSIESDENKAESQIFIDKIIVQ